MPFEKKCRGPAKPAHGMGLAFPPALVFPVGEREAGERCRRRQCSYLISLTRGRALQAPSPLVVGPWSISSHFTSLESSTIAVASSWQIQQRFGAVPHDMGEQSQNHAFVLSELYEM